MGLKLAAIGRLDSFESSVEGLVHDGGTADPDPVDLSETKLGQLAVDELLTPSLLVDTLLGESHKQLEVLLAHGVAVAGQSLAKFQTN